MTEQQSDHQLHDFISQRKQAGVSDYDIVSELVGNGWEGRQAEDAVKRHTEITRSSSVKLRRNAFIYAAAIVGILGITAIVIAWLITR